MGAITGDGEVTKVKVGDVVRIVERVNKGNKDDFHYKWIPANTFEGLGFSVDLPPESQELIEAGVTLVVTKTENGKPTEFKPF